MRINTGRRGVIASVFAGVMMSGFAKGSAQAAPEISLEPAGAKNLNDLNRQLSGMPRRRDFKTVPMILDKADQWDNAALGAILLYKGGPKQAWDNTDIAGPWLNGMRNSVNSYVWSFREPNFLCVSATHGPAHLALYDQDMWDKYQLAKIAGGTITRNTYIVAPSASEHDPADFQAVDGPFSSKDNGITVLQRRGVVFMACHNAIWELSERLVAAGQNPDHLAVDTVAAELTNHLIPEVVLTPGIVATLVKLQKAGFAYSR